MTKQSPLAHFAAMLWPAVWATSAYAGLYEPESVTPIQSDAACGIRADYVLSGSILRVELLTKKGEARETLIARVYQPNSSGPLMRDVWIKSPTIFSLGRFKPARENSNGIMEATGEITPAEADAFQTEIRAGTVEISIIFDGVMPVARLPVGLPAPLPDDVASALKTCRGSGG